MHSEGFSRAENGVRFMHSDGFSRAENGVSGSCTMKLGNTEMALAVYVL